MDVKGRTSKYSPSSSSTTQIIDDQDEMMAGDDDLRRGPWTVEEDLKLINYIATHGDGRWNSLARSAGLKRTGKSCRLRWLNYLRPDVRRGNITLEEQLTILELHSIWGNRWSKIAQQLPGRTDNEIKNYWRTRVQKHAKQLKCDVNSKQFKDTMKYLWMPRLIERIQAANATTKSTITAAAAAGVDSTVNTVPDGNFTTSHHHPVGSMSQARVNYNYTPENSSTSDSLGAQVSPVSDMTNECYIPVNGDSYFQGGGQTGFSDSIAATPGYFDPGLEFQGMDQQNNSWFDGGDASDNLINMEDIWFLQQQFNDNNI